MKVETDKVSNDFFLLRPYVRTYDFVTLVDCDEEGGLDEERR